MVRDAAENIRKAMREVKEHINHLTYVEGRLRDALTELSVAESRMPDIAPGCPDVTKGEHHQAAVIDHTCIGVIIVDCPCCKTRMRVE